MLVGQILKSKGDDGVMTVKPGTSIADAAQILAERRIGGLVDLQRRVRPEGILSERDIVRSLASARRRLPEERVEDMMTRKWSPARAGLLRRRAGPHDGRALPPHARGRGRPLVGIVTIGDVVGPAAGLAMEKDALEGMIMGSLSARDRLRERSPRENSRIFSARSEPVRSAIRSSASSMPTDSRSRLSGIPDAARSWRGARRGFRPRPATSPAWKSRQPAGHGQRLRRRRP